MTALTQSEVKIVLFALIFLGVLGAFMGLYYQNPVEEQTYTGTSNVSAQTTTDSDSWISGLIGDLPAPFDDANIAIITSIILTPIIIMLSYISIRAIKDLVSQWV